MNAKGKRFDRFPFFVLAADCEDGTENSLFRKKNKVFSFAAGRCNIPEICIVAKGVQMRKVGIICAGDEELEPFLRRMGKTAVSQKAMLSFHEGRAAGFSAAALFCGVGKVNAAAATQILIDDYGVDAVINAGTAGGMDESVGLFDTIVAETTFYHDVDDGILTEFHPWLPAARFEADPLLLAAAGRVCRRNAKVRRGLIVTGDRFVDGGMRSLLNREYAPLAADMETAAVAHVCHVNAIPFLAVRCITDTSVCPGQDAFEKNCARASEIAADIVFEILRELTVIVPALS